MQQAALILKHTRIQSGLNQSEFADRLGVKQSFLSAIERGTRKVSLKVANKLIEQFQVDANLLFDLDSTITNSTNAPLERTPQRTPKPRLTSSSTRKTEKSTTNEPDSKEENRQFNLLKADGIRSTVEAAAVGGEAARRWSQRRLLELRLNKEQSGVVSEGLTACFVASNMGYYSDQLLKHLYLITQQQVDRVLDQVIDKQIKASDAAEKIKAISAPLDALKEQFYGLEAHLVTMIDHIMHYFPNVANEVDLGPLDRGDLGWAGIDETSPDTE